MTIAELNTFKIVHKNTPKTTNLFFLNNTGDVILNDGRQQVSQLRSETRQGFPLSSFLFNIALEVLTRSIFPKTKVEIKASNLEINKVKLSLLL